MDYLDETLRRACEGRAFSAGGLNISELRDRLIKLYPEDKDEIMSTKRIDMKNSKWCIDVRDRVRSIEKEFYSEKYDLNEGYNLDLKVCTKSINTGIKS